MPYDHDDDPENIVQTRKRQAGQLDYINSYYQLPERFGVRAAIGGRVRHTDGEGEIVDTAGQYLRLLLDGATEPVIRHATANIAYWSPTAGWVQAARLPDPCATAGAPHSTGASR
ncbi:MULTISPECIES: hypothetical protein [Streptomyces]|uniref:Uncharacterized protein n=1 Tax=Streptomyces dengpaensis TaxID=2049881 RepID=A0ABN5IFB1_9ACTN|nr:MULTISPECIES: hypothetical protein [Streptomyces]AVH61778.1 hypothetical protein C4B68_40470 [Streptomyces dengpaensis]PIB05012.1 hypothetical protein B1C81_30315 [Streptomyces sp. HG99]